MRSRGCRWCLVLVLVVAWPVTAAAQRAPPDSPAWVNRPLVQVLDELRAGGAPLVYTNQLVTGEMVVTTEPGAAPLRQRLDRALAPHGLAIREAGDLWLVVRATPVEGGESTHRSVLLVVRKPGGRPGDADIRIDSEPPLPAPDRIGDGVFQFTGAPPGRYTLTIAAEGFATQLVDAVSGPDPVGLVTVTMERGPAVLDPLSVSASRYVLQANSQFFIDQRAIQALPDLGEDPVRSAHRLPGSAAGGLSSRAHFRGGLDTESAIYLNGLKLLDPFHIRDYNSIFSTIDARAISGVEAWTGGFPANYGDQMSGVLLLQSQRPSEPRRYEIGLSFYNSSLLASGWSEDNRYEWLVTARRSNLDLLLSDDLGKPDYADVFTELALVTDAGSRYSFNALYADDQVVVTTESDPGELEQSVSDTRNASAWIRIETPWTADLESDTVLSWSALEDDHRAQVNDPEQLVARVDDHLDVTAAGLDQNWRWEANSTHRLRWGFELRRYQADYDYRALADYREFYAAWPDIDNPLLRNIRTRPDGAGNGAYLADRWQLTPATAVDLGLRWDRQTWTEPHYASQLSPRISLLHDFSPDLQLRLGWGRYHQSQAIQRLQVEDGIDAFHPPERAEHWIAGIRWFAPGGYRFRAEAHLKRYDRLSPRYENLYDALALVPELEPDRVRLEPESARVAGLELSVEYRGEGPLDWWANYTFARATDRIDGASQPRSWDQRHALQAGLSWTRGPWEVGLALNWHTGWPTTGMSLGVEQDEDGEPGYFPVPGTRNAERLGGYRTVDFRVSREVELARGGLSMFFEVSNATNRRNPCCVDYDLDEDDDGEVVLDRTVDDWLPLIPAVGVLWEF